jgi:AcrR family transcriptional regulator
VAASSARGWLVVARDQRRAQVRAKLADAALVRFRAQGYSETTVDEIAQDAGVSRRTFFRYFPTKEEVFFSDATFRLAWFDEILRERMPHIDAWTAVTSGILEVACGLANDPARALEIHALLARSPSLQGWDLRHDQLWEVRIRDAFMAGGAPLFRATLIAGAMMGTIRAVLRTWYAEQARSDLVQLGRHALDLLAQGMAPHGGAAAATVPSYLPPSAAARR